MKVIWTKKSQIALDSIYKDIAEDNEIWAKKIIAHIINTVESTIKNFPHIGRAGNVFGTREYVIAEYPYVVIYTVKNNCLHVLKIYIHQCNTLSNAFSQSLLKNRLILK